MRWHGWPGLPQDSHIPRPGISNKMPENQQRRKVGWQSGEGDTESDSQLSQLSAHTRLGSSWLDAPLSRLLIYKVKITALIPTHSRQRPVGGISELTDTEHLGRRRHGPIYSCSRWVCSDRLVLTATVTQSRKMR